MDFFLRLLRQVLDYLALVYGNFFHPTKRGLIPPITNPILLLTATQISQRVKEGKLKAKQVVEAYFKRIEEINPLTNSVIEIRKEAFEDAIAIDERVDKELNQGIIGDDGRSIKDFPLLGVPFTCKDSVSIEGMHLVSGLPERKNIIALEDAPVIVNLRHSGAIPMALCNVPELLMWWDAHNPVFGRTNNPYDLSRIPGGSGGGDASTLASAASVISVGSDIGGSVRIPAFHCGIFAHKTSAGVISCKGKYPPMIPEKESLFAFGPMTRYASDLIPMLKAMAGDGIAKLSKIDEPVDISKLRVFYMEGDNNPMTTPLSPDMRNSLRAVVNHLEEQYKIKCTEISFDKFNYTLSMFKASLAESGSVPLTIEMTNRKYALNPFWELIKWVFGFSAHSLAVIMVAIVEKMTPPLETPIVQGNLAVRELLKKEFKEKIGDDGILLYPTFPEPATKHGTTLLKFSNVNYTSIFNVLGVPSTACPMGLNSEGLPLGVQVVANPYNDHYTIALAHEIEKTFGGWVPPCTVAC